MERHFRVISNEEYNKALDVIQKQRTLFMNTIEQFKKDLVFLQGCLAICSTELKDDDLSEESILFVLTHVGEMQSMLNDFDVVLSREDNKETENGGRILFNNNEDMCQGI